MIHDYLLSIKPQPPPLQPNWLPVLIIKIPVCLSYGANFPNLNFWIQFVSFIETLGASLLLIAIQEAILCSAIRLMMRIFKSW